MYLPITLDGVLLLQMVETIRIRITISEESVLVELRLVEVETVKREVDRDLEVKRWE